MVLSWNALTNSGGTGSSSAHLLPQPHDRLIRLIRWDLSVDQDQTANTARVAHHHSLCEEGPSRRTDEGSFFDPDRVHKRIDIGGEVLGCVAALGLVRISVPALGEREGMVLRGEQGEHPAEGEPGVRVPVEHDDGFSCQVALFGVVQTWSRQEGCRSELNLLF